MAIRMMVDAGTPGAVLDEYWTKTTGREIWMATTHAGLVLADREINGYDDSDFYALVWDEAAGEPKRITYATTRGWTYPNGCAVDATDEVKAKYAAYTAKLAAEARATEAAREAATPRKGKRVRTTRKVRGKNAVEAGVTGTVFWVGEDRFARTYWGARPMRIGFETDDGRRLFVADDAVEVTA